MRQNLLCEEMDSVGHNAFCRAYRLLTGETLNDIIVKCMMVTKVLFFFNNCAYAFYFIFEGEGKRITLNCLSQ